MKKFVINLFSSPSIPPSPKEKDSTEKYVVHFFGFFCPIIYFKYDFFPSLHKLLNLS